MLSGTDAIVVSLAKALEVLGDEDFELKDNRFSQVAWLSAKEKVYLLQAVKAGIPRKFTIVWRKWPVPLELMFDVLDMYARNREYFTEKTRQLPWTQEDEKKVQCLKKLLKLPEPPSKGHEIHQALWLSFVCSLHHLANTGFVNTPWPQVPIEKLKEELCLKEPELLKYEYYLDKAWERLTESIGEFVFD